MDFIDIDLERIKAFCFVVTDNKPIEEYKNVYKSVFESFDKFCQSKKNI